MPKVISTERACPVYAEKKCLPPPLRERLSFDAAVGVVLWRMTRGEIAKWILAERARTFRPVDEPIKMPIDGVLDLHTFRPRDVKDLVPDYLAACREKGILLVRIIHGKGIGNLRRTVHALLSRDAGVDSFALDHPEYGGWGATLVRLKPMESTCGPDATKPIA